MLCEKGMAMHTRDCPGSDVTVISKAIKPRSLFNESMPWGRVPACHDELPSDIHQEYWANYGSGVLGKVKNNYYYSRLYVNKMHLTN